MMRFLSGVFFVVALFCCVLFSGCSSDKKNVDSCLFAASAALDEGKWAKALEYADAALAFEPENINALVLRAVAAERLGKRDVALDSARMAVKINPDSFMAQYTLGRLYAADPSRRSDAVAPLARALSLRDGDRNTLVMLVNVNSALNSDAALRYLNELALQDRELAKTAGFQNQLGIAYARRNERKLALDAFVAAYKKDDKNPQIVLNTAVFVDRYYGKPSQAAAFYRSYLNVASSNPELSAQRALVQARLKELERTR